MEERTLRIWKYCNRKEKVIIVVTLAIIVPTIYGAVLAMQRIAKAGILSWFEHAALFVTVLALAFWACVSYHDSYKNAQERNRTITFQFTRGDGGFVSDFEAFMDKHFTGDKAAKQHIAEEFVKQAIYNAMRDYEKENRII